MVRKKVKISMYMTSAEVGGCSSSASGQKMGAIQVGAVKKTKKHTQEHLKCKLQHQGGFWLSAQNRTEKKTQSDHTDRARAAITTTPYDCRHKRPRNYSKTMVSSTI